MAEAGDPAVRAHELSPEAVAYKARRTPSVPLAMPELSDFDAVGRWRSETNAVWGESDDPNVPHERITIAGVDCLMAGPSHESADAHNAPTVVYAHGGGYVLGGWSAIGVWCVLFVGRARLSGWWFGVGWARVFCLMMPGHFVGRPVGPGVAGRGGCVT